MGDSARLSLPFIAPGQANKELVHNEALQLLDFLVAGCVVEGPRDVPPATSAVGDCYIVGPAPDGAWAGRAGALAGFSEGGWRFVAPVAGMRLMIAGAGIDAVFDGTAWTVGTVRAARVEVGGLAVVGPRRPAIPAPSGGTTVDVNARSTIAAILTALRSHGLIAE